MMALYTIPFPLAAIFGKLSDKSANQRSIRGTLADIQQMIDNGEITTSLELLGPKDAMNAYVQGMSRAIIGRRALNSMLTLEVGTPDGGKGLRLPALVTLEDLAILKENKNGRGLNKQEGLHYLEFEHPALKGYAAHTNVHAILNDFFAIRHRGGIGDIAEKILKLNNALKRVFVFGSLFHAQALFMSGMYSMGLVGAIKGVSGKGALGKRTYKDANLR